MPDTAALASVVDNIADRTLDYAVLLAAIGTLAMAVLELLKGAFGLRRHYHRKRVAAWMPDAACRAELLLLAAGGEEGADALYDLPPERMLGQIQAAANVALDFPDRYAAVYRFLTQGGPDGEVWGRFAASGAAERDAAAREAQAARARLGNLVARRLDAFQTRTQYRWARINQGLAVAIGAGISGYALASTSAFRSGNDFAALAGLSLLAGMLAPFAKDVVSALAGLRAQR